MFRLVTLLLLLPVVGGAQRVTHFGDPSDGFAQYSGIADSQRVVIRDTTAWRRYWSVIHRPFIPAPAIPEVDFTREMVVLAALGTRPSGGFGIRIDAATVDSTRILVQVTRIIPGRGCALPAVVTAPVDLVRVPATPLPVAFTEREQRTDCSRLWAPNRR